MARRRKGRPIDGWLLLDKPLGLGSTAAVAKARWALQAQKVGHAGTLDPLATGLLAIAFGEATKTVPFAMDGAKTYRFTVRWGAATETDDLEGAISARSELRPTAAQIDAEAARFRGEIMQRPPAYSAIKIDGARAYDLARSGAAPELAPRPIRVDRLARVGGGAPAEALEETEFEAVCGKGGYVRAFARDLGEALGCLGHVTALRRVAAGPFRIEDSIPFDLLEELRNRSASESALLPVAAGLDDIPAIAVDRDDAALLRQGRSARIAGAAAGAELPHGETAWASLNGTPIAVGVVTGGELRPTRVFNMTAPEGGASRDKDDDVDYGGTQAAAD